MTEGKPGDSRLPVFPSHTAFSRQTYLFPAFSFSRLTTQDYGVGFMGEGAGLSVGFHFSGETKV